MSESRSPAAMRGMGVGGWVAALFGLALAAAVLAGGDRWTSLDGAGVGVSLVALAALAALVLGDTFARWFRVAPTMPERLVAGLFLLSTWPLLVGSLGLLAIPDLALAALVLPLVIVPALAAARVRALTGELVRSLAAQFRPEGFVAMALCALTFVAAGWGALSVLVPPVGLDAPSYHLGIPIQYLRHGTLLPPDTMGYYLYWQQFEMLVLPFVAADRSGLAANLLGYLVYLALVGVAAVLGGERNTTSRWLAASLAATSPLVLLLLSYTKNDLLAAAGVLAAACAIRTVKAGGGGEAARPGGVIGNGWAGWAGFLIGGALAVKPSTAFSAAPVFLVALLSVRKRALAAEGGAEQTTGAQGLAGWRSAIALGGGAVLLPATWVVRNVAWSGGPLPPNVVSMATAGAGSPFETMAERLVHLARSFVQFLPENIEGPAGPLLLFSGVVFLLSRSTPFAWRAAALVGVLAWLPAGFGVARYLLPLALLAGVLGAAPLAALGRPARLVAVLLAALSIFFVVRVHIAYSPFLLVHAGTMTREDFATHWVNTYPIQAAAAERLPEDALVASVGEPHLFYLDRRALYDVYWQRPRLLDLAHEHHDPGRLAGQLRAIGVTHVLFNPGNYDAAVARGGTRAPRCDADTNVLRALLLDTTLARPWLADPARPGLGLFRLLDPAAPPARPPGPVRSTAETVVYGQGVDLR